MAAAMAVSALLAVCGVGCDVTGTEEGTLWDLDVRVIEGAIQADLMPPIPKDPIVCFLRLRMANRDPDDAVTGVSVPDAAVLSSRTGKELGTIRFETAWDGCLGAGEADTVTVVKITESEEIFPPPCLEQVFLRVRIVKTSVQTRRVKSPSYLFLCPVAWESRDR